MAKKHQPAKKQNRQKGFIFTIDVLLALLVTFVTFVTTFTLLAASRPVEIQFVYLRTFSLDAMSVMEKQGYLADSLASPNETDTTKLRSFIYQTPPEMCMYLEIFDSSMLRVYSVEKNDCLLGGEEFQVAWRSFVRRQNATAYRFYLARLTSWYKQPASE